MGKEKGYKSTERIKTGGDYQEVDLVDQIQRFSTIQANRHVEITAISIVIVESL